MKPSTTPVDLAMTTTNIGVTVPDIVRVDRGTINRAIYDLALLFDPTRPCDAFAPQAGWIGQIVHAFGSSAGKPRLQTHSSQNWADDASLSRGFMLTDNSLTDSANNSNRMLNVETLMMMKEHIREKYGDIKATLGKGCSGDQRQEGGDRMPRRPSRLPKLEQPVRL